ncbi:MAG: patatin-like phospholipase family protein, partial [Spirochaetales bacterium]|nr:patatin-like phospholipase family protein [Spirochaetales bacterium]
MKRLFLLLVVVLLACASVFAEDPEIIDDNAQTETEAVTEEEAAAETASEAEAEIIDDVPEAPAARPTVALVLAGGGAKGIAHIPIIEALETYGIPIDKVFGTSMGALIGGLYAAGLSPSEMKDIVTSNDLTKLFTSFQSEGYTEVLDAFDFNSNNVLSISLGQGIGGISGFIDDYMVLNFLVKYIGNVPDGIDFDKDLVVPFECNSSDMLTGDEMVFRSGSLLTAMRSSMSLPLVFEPVVLENGTVLMDGGMVSNYIAHRAEIEGYDIIIVVTLDGYGKNRLSADNYSSLSGVAGSTLSIVLNNVSKGEVELADYWFSPDMTGYGTLSFGSSKGILERGYTEVEEQKAKLEEIAALFTEDQKVYKDPQRIGEYHTRYEERNKTEYQSTKEYRHEDLMGRTRISLGIYGSGGYGFYFNKSNENERTQRALFPVLSLRAFLKNVAGSRFSFDTRLKLSMSRTTDVSVLGLFGINPDDSERLYALARVKGQIGSRTYWTDKSAMLRLNEIEGLVGLDLGTMLTNESDHSIQMYFSADNSWDIANELGAVDGNLDNAHAFVPSATLSAIFYPEYENGFFSQAGSRFDFIGKAGYNIRTEAWFYTIGLAAETNFKLSNKVSIWLDATAFSARGSDLLRSSFEEYGGWDGMPGYAAGSLMGEFINGGLGLQITLKEGFASSFLAFIVRGGIRSDVQYGWSNYAEFDSKIPFSGLKTWDVGGSVGYGFSTPVGDIIFGAGFNNNLQLAL